MKADPRLTKRFENLELALHGKPPGRERGPLNWNGVDETTLVFESIEDLLNQAKPPDRPTKDLPDGYETKRSGD